MFFLQQSSLLSLLSQYIHHSPENSRRGFGIDCAILTCQVSNIYSNTMVLKLWYMYCWWYLGNLTNMQKHRLLLINYLYKEAEEQK